MTTRPQKKLTGAALRSDFPRRFELALRLHNLTRLEFSKRVKEQNGHQVVYNWLQRGRIGPSSFDAVRALLPGIAMDWLNDGIGPDPDQTTVERALEGLSKTDYAVLANAFNLLVAFRRVRGTLESPISADEVRDAHQLVASSRDTPDTASLLIRLAERAI